MNQSSIEAQWQSQTERRRRIIRFMLLIVLFFSLLLIGFWFWVTQPLLSSATPNPERIVDPSRLEAHVRKLSIELAPRDEGHIENLDRVAAYIKNEFSQTTPSVSEQPYRVQGKSYRNVIAQFGPESEERIVVGAHYDTAGPLPGADDNASGVAGLIELARLLGRQQPPLRVELVAFTLEEPPYFRTTGMGSSVHAESLRKQNIRVRAMFSLEMIGYFSDVPNSQQFPVAVLSPFYPSTGNFIAVVGRFSEGLLVRETKATMRNASPLPVYSINAPTFVPGVDFSDQLSYWHAGYSGVMITDTAFYRNRNYHTAQDTQSANKIELRIRTMRTLWTAMLLSIGAYYVFTFFAGRSENISPNRTLSLMLVGVALLTTLLSFLVRNKLLSRAVEQQQVQLVQQGYIVTWAITEVAALLGLLDFFLTGDRYYYLLFLIAACGLLLHFPRREYVINASFKSGSFTGFT